MSDPIKPSRRPRYKGTHPKKFAEKYKELNPNKFAGEQEKVCQRGHTPAGTHRPVMVDEIIRVLNPKPGEWVLDATLGFGGHSIEILPLILPQGHLVGLDVDPLELPKTEKRLREFGYSNDVFTVKRMNFAGLPGLLGETGCFDCILADLGLSSMQIDNPERGFSFKVDGPLDLRLNPQRGIPAFELLATLSEEKITELLIENSDEPYAKEIAKGLITYDMPIKTTRNFASVIRNILKLNGLGNQDPELKKSLQRCFQALRIEVNDEFRVLEQFLNFLPKALKPSGRVAILTFHSGEDRRVKKSFQEGFKAGYFSAICDNPKRPSQRERGENPRSSPAKLRWAVKA